MYDLTVIMYYLTVIMYYLTSNYIAIHTYIQTAILEIIPHNTVTVGDCSPTLHLGG